MPSKKYKVKRRSKPIFNTKQQGNSYLGILFMIIILLALVFVGYSVGKPIMDFINGADEVIDDNPASSVSEPEPATTPDSSESTAESEPVPETPDEPEITAPKNILFINIPDDGSSYDEYLASKIDYAIKNNYSGVCVELIAEGGIIGYNTSVVTAKEAEAVSESGIVSLKQTVSDIAAAGLTPYARISALSDNIASWYDKGLAYMIEGSDSRWLDNKLDKGGKPWISPFSDGAREYIGGLVKEISQAGFAGIFAGELEFPEMRSSDLNYIGDKVKSKERYKELIGFGEELFNSFGTAKEFYIEVNAEDIISGKAEVLSNPEELFVKTIYVNFNPQKIGRRISRPDGTEVSFDGLNDTYMLKTVFRLVNSSLDGSDLKIIPKINGCEITSDLLEALKDMGYGEENVILS